MRRQVTSSARVRPVLPVRAAIYARVSSDQQAERHTIDSQVGALLARASADGHDVTSEFRFLDDGHSGASLIRPALERLRNLVADLGNRPCLRARTRPPGAEFLPAPGRPGAGVRAGRRRGRVPRPGQFGRTPRKIPCCCNCRACLRSMSGHASSSAAAAASATLAQAGVVSVLTRAPYGYRYVGREAGGGAARFEVIEDKAEVVRRIFRWVGQERVGLAMVSRRLFEAGVPSPTGKAGWSRSMIWVLLSTNSAYAGRALFGKNASVPWQPPLRPARGRAPVPSRPFRQVPGAT